MRLLLTLILIGPLALLPVQSNAFDLEQSLREVQASYRDDIPADYAVAQRGDGMSLSQAIESVRKRTGGRIVSAETKVSGNREIHHIKVLTEDGKVKTVKVPGRSRQGR